MLDFVKQLELALGVNAEKKFLPMQAGDVPATYADTSKLAKVTNFKPDTPISMGVRKYAEWFIDYYKPSKADKELND